MGYLLSEGWVFEFFREADYTANWTDFFFKDFEMIDLGAEIRNNKLLIPKILPHNPLQKV